MPSIANRSLIFLRLPDPTLNCRKRRRNRLRSARWPPFPRLSWKILYPAHHHAESWVLHVRFSSSIMDNYSNVDWQAAEALRCQTVFPDCGYGSPGQRRHRGFGAWSTTFFSTPHRLNPRRFPDHFRRAPMAVCMGVGMFDRRSRKATTAPPTCCGRDPNGLPLRQWNVKSEIVIPQAVTPSRLARGHRPPRTGFDRAGRLPPLPD